MKNVWSIIALTLLTVGLTHPIRAQQTFDSKKKEKKVVNTTSLRALKINGASRVNAEVPMYRSYPARRLRIFL